MRLSQTGIRLLRQPTVENSRQSSTAAVHKMTGLSAHNFRLAQRGVVREGYFADLCLFDANTVLDTATFERPISPSVGIDTVIVNGAMVWAQGKVTGERPGRVLRRQSGAM